MNTRTKLSLALLASLSCAVAQAETETRDVSGFTAIDASGGINVDIRIGNEFLVEVDADEDLDDIETEVRGDTLYLRIDRGDWNWNGNWTDDYSAVIVMPALSELEVSGGSDVQVTGVITGEEFELNASGGADVELEVAVTEIDINISGGADVEVSGTADIATARSSGGSDLDARQLEAKAADLRSSGGSDLAMTVTETLEARASGAADITYYGDPEVLDDDESGGADISHR